MYKKMIYVFFSHNGKEKRIIEIAKIIKEHIRDKTDIANKFYRLWFVEKINYQNQ
jgi:rubrerythrin